MFSAHLSRRMIVAKYVDGITLLQPVDQVWRVEKLTPYNRNMQKKNQKSQSFGSLFRRALNNHTTDNKDKESNGFDVLC